MKKTVEGQKVHYCLQSNKLVFWVLWISAFCVSLLTCQKHKSRDGCCGDSVWVATMGQMSTPHSRVPVWVLVLPTCNPASYLQVPGDYSSTSVPALATGHLDATPGSWLRLAQPCLVKHLVEEWTKRCALSHVLSLTLPLPFKRILAEYIFAEYSKD